jgi:cysteine synthase A
VDQNNNPLNPEVYRRWLVPRLESKIDPTSVGTAVFGVGSGGHFTALVGWLKAVNPLIRAFAVDRIGSVTFGGEPGVSFIRGLGNQNTVPKVMSSQLHLVDEVIYVSDRDAMLGARELAAIHGLFLGGSSGAVYVAARRVAMRMRKGNLITMFPDRGELYIDTLYNDRWMEAHDFLDSSIPANKRYGDNGHDSLDPPG